MTDSVIRDVADDGLRRVLAAQQGPAVTRSQLSRFAELTADLSDPEAMAAAWR